ncbi:MAG: DUF134 domain-containing protein [Candidatus Omnitrophota bacterium]
MKPKGRPKKIRLVEKVPEVGQFSPRGKPGRPNEIELAIDQFEALRLVDYKGLKHRQAAGQMGLSRQTLERILKQARKNISDAIINGKIIRIIGGNITIK